MKCFKTVLHFYTHELSIFTELLECHIFVGWSIDIGKTQWLAHIPDLGSCNTYVCPNAGTYIGHHGQECDPFHSGNPQYSFCIFRRHDIICNQRVIFGTELFLFSTCSEHCADRYSL